MKEMSKKMFDEMEGLYDRIYINTAELAKMLGVSNGWVEIHRKNIVGARQFNGKGRWFFDPHAIRAAVAAGNGILIKEAKK
jgi:hypothetical protein